MALRYIRMFYRRIAKDLRQKELIPLKVLFFIHASTLFVLYPYLTIHMRELGINVEETAIMSAVIPVVAIIMPPVSGMIADKIGNFKLLLSIFSTLGGLSALLLLLVPVGRITITYPEKVVLGLSCNPNKNETRVNLSVYENHIVCKPLHENVYDAELTLETCGIVCQAITNADDSISILSTKGFNVQFHTLKDNTVATHSFKTTSDGDGDSSSRYENNVEEVRARRAYKMNDDYKGSVRKMSENSYFFPTHGLFNFHCKLHGIHDSQYYNATTMDVFELNSHPYYACQFEPKDAQKDYKIVTKILYSPNETNELENLKMFKVVSIVSNESDALQNYGTTCESGFGQTGQHISVKVPFTNKKSPSENKTIQLESCAPRCIATVDRKDMCSNMNVEKENDMTLTFWSYLAVRVFIAMIGGTAFAMFEGAVIAILREKNADYGLQRIYASIGGMISSPASGWLIDYYSRGKNYTDFRPAFYLYAVLKVVSGLLMLAINLEFKVPATNVVADVVSVLKKVEMIALFISCFILGTAWGYIESFLFWFLQDLGGSRSLMGFTITVGGIAGIPLLVMSGPIIKKIGHANVIFIGFIFYGIRLMGYSLIYNPWHCLIFEAMESVTSSLSFTAAVTYAAKLSSVTTDSSIQGMLGGIYYGVGKGSGSLIGGYLMKLVGTRYTYQIFAGAAVFTGIIYFLFNHLCIKRTQDTDEKEVDVPQTFVDLPPGFVEIDLTPSWNAEKDGEPTDHRTPSEPSDNNGGQTNLAFNLHEHNNNKSEQIQKKLNDHNEVDQVTETINDQIANKKNTNQNDNCNSVTVETKL